MRNIRKQILLGVVSFLLVVGIFSPVASVEAATPAQIGYVNFTYLVDQHPDTAKLNEELKKMQDEQREEYKQKEVGLSDDEKKALAIEFGVKVEQKRRELYKIVADKIVTAANETAKEKNLGIVIDSKIVVCGGVNITDDVLKKIVGK